MCVSEIPYTSWVFQSCKIAYICSSHYTLSHTSRPTLTVSSIACFYDLFHLASLGALA